MINRNIQPLAEYIENKFDSFVAIFKPCATHIHTKEFNNQRMYLIKLTTTKIQNWTEIPKEDLLDLSVSELVMKYTKIKNTLNQEKGM